MRIGLLADVHEAVEPLVAAIERLKSERVDRLVFLGDVFERGHRLETTLDAMIAAGVAESAWGNHDFGLCDPSDPEMSATLPPSARAYLHQFVARFEIDGMLFQHIPASYDPTTLEGIWSCFEEVMTCDSSEPAAHFAASPHRASFCGHFHRWRHATPAGFNDWNGEAPLRLDPATRHFVAIHAVVDGRCALLDTDENVLIPYRL